MNFDQVKLETVSLLYKLLPGFIAAWMFYGFTAHRKNSTFERVIQALIFTAFIQVLVYPIGLVFLFIGEKIISIGYWNENTSFVLSMFVAVFLGFVFSACANTSFLHQKVLPDCITTRTSFPSEWFSAFIRDRRYIYLHLKGGRRLYGWPTEWPDHPDEGHFVIQEPEWVLKDNQRAKLLLTHKILIPVSEVEMVEFEKNPDERNYDEQELERSEEMLIALQKEFESSDEDCQADAVQSGEKVVVDNIKIVERQETENEVKDSISNDS